MSTVFISMGTLFGEVSTGLREVNGIRSSLVRPSFCSYEANEGSLSLPGPFAPLTLGIVGCTAPGSGDSLACRL